VPDTLLAIPDHPLAIPDHPLAIPDHPLVIPAPDQVRGFNIRDPVLHRDWIAGRGPQ
jgi:hypothetical protein